MNSAGSRVYVANEGSNSVSVIDAANNAVAATIPVGDSPSGVAVMPAGSRAYVTNAAGNSVSVVNAAGNAVIGTIHVGTGPGAIAVNSAGTRVYVANSDNDSVSVIDTAVNALADTIAVGNEPDGVAVNPSGTRVYVADQAGNSVSVINADTNSVIATVPVGGGPTGVAVNPSGTRVYVANFDDDSISVIDTGSNTVATTIPVGSHPEAIALNPAGTRAYVANLHDPMSVVDTASNAVTASIPVGVGTEGVAVNPAGTAAYVSSVVNNTVSVIGLTPPASSTVAVVSSRNPSRLGEAVTFTATESPAGSDGTVQWLVDGAAVGAAVPVVGGSAMSAPIANLSAGSHLVTAQFSGTTMVGPSTASLTQTVTAAPSGSSDHTGPIVHVTGAKNGHTYSWKHRHRDLHCVARDVGSGVKSCKVTRTHAVHPKFRVVHYTAVATDRAGNKTTLRGHYRIRRTHA